jgi:hypothetical protein
VASREGRAFGRSEHWQLQEISCAPISMIREIQAMNRDTAHPIGKSQTEPPARATAKAKITVQGSEAKPYDETANPALGRGLINAQPQSDGRKLDERKVVGRKLVVAGCHAPKMLDLIKEPLDQISGSIQIRAEADRLVAIAPRWSIGPSAPLVGECSDPLGVVASVRQQHRSRFQTREELACEPIVVCFASRQCELDRQAIRIDKRMNLTGQTAP